MTDFDALLKRSFAEAHEPADDGFVVNVTAAVAHREASMKARTYVQYGAMTIGLAAVSWGLYSALGALGPIGQEMMASLGLEVARAHAAVSTAPDVSASAQNFAQSMGVGLTQILMVAAALAGGAVALRSTRE